MGLKSILGGSKTESTKKRPPLRNESLREDPADEHKRVARRRLIGAVALLLLAIIILPLVLEDAPKPVSSDIALQIPSRDLAVRSNPDATPPAARDEGAAGKSDAKEAAAASASADSNAAIPAAAKQSGAPKASSEGKPDAKSDIKSDVKSDVKAELKPETKADAKPVARADAKPESRADAKVDNKAEHKAETRTDPKPAAKPADVKTAEPKAGKHLNVVQGDDPIAGFANAKPVATPTAPALASTAGSAPGSASSSSAGKATIAPASGRSNHWVQIGAFGNEGKAREMASQLRGKGYPAVTEVVRSSNGSQSELYRVRVGPLETRESASRARDNLARSGFEGAVVQ